MHGGDNRMQDFVKAILGWLCHDCDTTASLERISDQAIVWRMPSSDLFSDDVSFGTESALVQRSNHTSVVGLPRSAEIPTLSNLTVSLGIGSFFFCCDCSAVLSSCVCTRVWRHALWRFPTNFTYDVTQMLETPDLAQYLISFQRICNPARQWWCFSIFWHVFREWFLPEICFKCGAWVHVGRGIKNHEGELWGRIWITSCETSDY